ncbi:hypothetical protein ACFYYD_37130 [Streptomyces bluensis]|uniref:hypothetical protein n=1 Tax=Streptomyces bluensis TaxID=33897 RepID=UPI0036B2D820
MPAQIEAFTSVRTFAASASNVVKPGSSSPASTTFSSAMLIRSAGRFFDTASLRITASAIFRAFALSYDRHVGKHPMHWYDFSTSNWASRCSSQSVRAVAHSTSSRPGAKNKCSSCAVISRLNRGYAVLSRSQLTPPRMTSNVTTNDAEPNG